MAMAKLLSRPQWTQPISILESMPLHDAHNRLIGYELVTSTTADCVTTPAGFRELMELPEGDRNQEARKFYTKGKLSCQAGNYSEVLYAGKKFRVVKVNDFSEYGFSCAIGVAQDPLGDQAS